MLEKLCIWKPTAKQFGNNKIDIQTENGKIYYVRHYTKFGLI